MANTPLILVHYGWFDGISTTLECLRRYSPGTPVYLIGDNITRQHAQCEPVEDYSQDIGNLLGIYQHHSPNSPAFELACYQRWFVARNFALAKEFKEMWLIDTDVLVFCDLEQHKMEPLAEAVMCLVTMELLNDFCGHILDLYRDSAKLAEFVRLYNTGALQSISDMTLAAHHRDQLGKHSQFLVNNGCAFDSNVHFKPSLIFADGVPWFFSNGQWVKMLTLHAWAYYKPKMKEYLDMAARSATISLV